MTTFSATDVPVSLLPFQASARNTPSGARYVAYAWNTIRTTSCATWTFGWKRTWTKSGQRVSIQRQVIPVGRVGHAPRAHFDRHYDTLQILVHMTRSPSRTSFSLPWRYPRAVLLLLGALFNIYTLTHFHQLSDNGRAKTRRGSRQRAYRAPIQTRECHHQTGGRVFWRSVRGRRCCKCRTHEWGYGRVE